MKQLKGYMHGANLGHWLSQYGSKSEAHWNSYITKKRHCPYGGVGH